MDDPRTSHPVLEYRKPQARKLWHWIDLDSPTNDCACLALCCNVIAFALHIWWMYSRAPGPTASNAAALVAVFVVLLLIGISVALAVAGLVQREGRMWPAWTTIVLSIVQIVVFRFPQ